MNASESIILGVVSGILTSVVLELLTGFVRKVLIPWYRQLIYKGIDISGDWYSSKTNPSGNVQETVMSIKQRADKVTCSMTIAKKNQKTNQTEIKTFDFLGGIQDRFVSISGKNVDKQALGIHSELLEIVGDGKIMQGQSIWYSVTNKEIQAGEILWTRK